MKKSLLYTIFAAAILTGFAACKREGKPAAPPAPAPPATEPAAPAPAPEPAPLPATEPKTATEAPVAPKPVPAAVAQPEAARIAYNGLETNMKGQIGGTKLKEYLLRVRKDQQLTINLITDNPDCLLAVLDADGAQIGKTGQNWSWLTTYAGDLRLKVSLKPGGNTGQTDFTIRVAPY